MIDVFCLRLLASDKITIQRVETTEYFFLLFICYRRRLITILSL